MSMGAPIKIRPSVTTNVAQDLAEQHRRYMFDVYVKGTHGIMVNGKIIMVRS